MINRKDPGVFNCTICGDCCTDFHVVVDPWIEEGMVHMVKDGSIGLELWPWEARVMIPLANSLNLDLVLLPSNIIMDDIRDKPVVLSYFLANETCPFLEDKECRIHKERPNVCRYFPLVLAKSGITISSRCPDTVSSKAVSGKGLLALLHGSYSDQVDYLLKDIYIHESIIDLLGKLELGGSVRWRWDPDPDAVLKKVQDQEWMDLLEFITDIGYMTFEETERMVVDMLYVENIDEKVDLRLLTM